MSAASAKIRLRSVVKAFGEKVVLNGLDLDVQPGESVVVIGGSGTGKSVLIKNIIGLMYPDSGTIEVDGEEVTHMSAGEREHVTRKFGMLFQGAALFDSLRVWENVAFGLMQAHAMGRNEAKEKAIATLARVGLGPPVGELMPASLSAGMQKRVSLARAIATDPEIIFFDEPTTGIDPIMGSIIDQLIVSTVKDMGATALTITHDMDSARRIADRIAMIYQGRIIWSGAPDEIEASGDPHVKQFIHGEVHGPIQMQVRA